MDHSRIAAEGDLEALQLIAEGIADRCSVRIVRPPAPGMVMVRHIDPLEGTPFYLGEAYVTECEVEVDNRLGYGCCLGSSEQRALYAAMIDAVVGGGHPLAAVVLPLLRKEADRIGLKWSLDAAAAAGTRVDFQVR